MDLISIPACAMYRSVGTVIVRIRMEVRGGCGDQRRTSHPVNERISSGCERCNRTRLISKHNSDCDSDVEKYRPYRSSTARSRYVNVSAAVCLLLLVGGLSPQSSAAPQRSHIMDRQRRQICENRLWANPCDYNDANTNREISQDDVKKLTSDLVKQANSLFSSAEVYKKAYATLHSYSNFDDLLMAWESYDWLRKFSWYRDEVLPKEKILYSPVSDQYVNDLMNKLDDVLPAMYKGLKMIVAGLNAFSEEGLNDYVDTDEVLKKNTTMTMHGARAVLCSFSDYMKYRKLEILPLYADEIPDFTTGDKLSTGLLLYRDTLNYLEYIAQVFKKINEIS